MSRVDELAAALSAAILESDEYKHYLAARDEIAKNPQLYMAVNELRKHNFEFQNDSKDVDMYDEVAKMFDKYAYIRTSVVANRFLRAEVSLCRMIQDIQRTVVEQIDLDVSFLE